MTGNEALAADVWAVGSAAPGRVGAVSPELVGVKANGLIRMAQAGLPVPPGFVLSTRLCRRYHREGPQALADAAALARRQITALQAQTSRIFGDARRPLLLSVRSGAAVSMPGMLETILNVGLNEASVRGLIRITGDPRFAWDCFRRFIQQFAQVVHGCTARPFDEVIGAELRASGADTVRDLDFAALERVVHEFLNRYRTLTGKPFPHDPHRQLEAAIEAVMRSWMSEKAQTFRRLKGLSDEGGTAVTVQAMVFGNAGAGSGSGVGFTRDPDTGEKHLYVDFLFNAQGEDVVSGRFTVEDGRFFRQSLPGAAAEIERIAHLLEAEFGDMQDFEFTVERGQLHLLQTRPGYRSPLAAVRIAVDLVEEGLIDPETALARLSGIDIAHIERRQLVVPAGVDPIAHAIPAAAGAAVGAVCFDAPQVERTFARQVPAILVRHDIATADVAAIAQAEGIVTAAGARTSHAAVVARQLGKACLVGCDSLSFPTGDGVCRFGNVVVAGGEELSVDGTSGTIYRGRLAVESERLETELAKIEKWRESAQGSEPADAIAQ
jgi:pyruvate,orthophosphate dikinase